VLSIEGGAAPDAIANLIAGALAPYQARGTTPERIALPGDVPAMRYREREWAPWRSIVWTESPGELSIGIGDGESAMTRWLALPPARDDGSHFDLHRRSAREALGAGDAVCEVYVSIDRVREAFDDRFDDDPGARLLEAIHLANGRSFMLHVIEPESGGAWRIGATWSVRSEPRSTIRRIELSDPDAAAAAAAATAVLADWPAWTVGALDAYAALLDERDALVFARQRRTWSSRRLPILARLATAVGPNASFQLDRDGSGCALGAIVVRIPVREGARSDAVARDFRALMDPFADRISEDREGGTWWLRSKAPAPISVVSWGVARRDGRDELILAIDLGTGTEWSWTAVPRAREAGR
jgi:hypothetical protein